MAFGLTRLDGQDGEVVDRVDLPIQRLGRADDAAQRVDVEEALQIRVPVDGVPGGNIAHAQKNAPLKMASGVDLTFSLGGGEIVSFLFTPCNRQIKANATAVATIKPLASEG